MNWQEWVVGLLIILCVARILYGIYVFFRRVKENDNPCASCASGCELKDMMEKKRKECSSKKKRQRKIAADSLVVSKFVLPLQPQTRNKVPWMSGLVSGLQNRVRRFESARNLKQPKKLRSEMVGAFVVYCLSVT